MKMISAVFQTGAGKPTHRIEANRCVDGIIRAEIAPTSRATAQRELADLVNKGILVKLSGGGRSITYNFDWERYRKSGNQ